MKMKNMMRGILLPVIVLVQFAVLNAQEKLQYHLIKTDKQGGIIPWYNASPAIAYDHVIDLVWNFWDTMRFDMNGIPYYMNHQVWCQEQNDPRGIGGDQIQMALSSWRLLYGYTGNERIRENMRFMADYYLTNGLSPAGAAWPNIPYPYNTLTYSGKYDGDMIIGKDFTQPDKAGSFGFELINLYKMTCRERYPNKTSFAYLDAAVKIANTLAAHITEGDYDHSPMPFKVNVYTNETGHAETDVKNVSGNGSSGAYTTNYAATMELFLSLQELNKGDVEKYKKAFETVLAWMKKFPLQSNRWGPFFEDVVGWSDTQINAITFAQFIMNHPEYFPEWKSDVRKIFDWVYAHLSNDNWKKYGVTAINEQTVYKVPGNSHTSRQASAELQYIALTGDTTGTANAIRQLNWATYMVDNDGKNRYMHDDNWLTDGYGDYVRHYLRAMAAMPSLTPPGEAHLLSTSSVFQHIYYKGQFMKNIYSYDYSSGDTLGVVMLYKVFGDKGTEKIHLAEKPGFVRFNDRVEADSRNTYEWKPSGKGKDGVLIVRREAADAVAIVAK